MGTLGEYVSSNLVTMCSDRQISGGEEGVNVSSFQKAILQNCCDASHSCRLVLRQRIEASR